MTKFISSLEEDFVDRKIQPKSSEDEDQQCVISHVRHNSCDAYKFCGVEHE